MTVDIVPEWFPKDKVCIVGLGQTEYTPWGQIGRPELQIALEAIIAAVKDAGIKMTDVDGICSNLDERSGPPELATALGLPHMRFSNQYWGGGGGGGCGSVMNSALAIAYGYANYVVVYRSLAQNPFGRFDNPPPVAASSMAFSMPWGAFNPVHQYAFQARRHMSLYGTTSRQFGAISVACYKHAQRNPTARMYGHPITLADHQKSEIVCDPIRQYDCALESDGAVAVLLTSVERAKDLKQRPVYIRAVAQGSGLRQTAAAYNKADFDTANFTKVAADLWKLAGITPKDVGVAQIYENVTPMTLMSIEDHGFCKKGEGGAFVEKGRLEWPNGALPTNTSGGNTAEAYMHGFELITEAVRQMRGTSTCQVKDAEFCLVTGGPGISPVSDMIVRR